MKTHECYNPKVLILRVTRGCNAGCFMCDFARLPVNYSFSLEDAQQLTRSELYSSIELVRFTGGEPLLLTQVGELIGVFSNSNRKTSIITNGWFLKERIAELADAGLNQLVISVDGHTSAKHDRFRRTKGLFERIHAGVEELNRIGAAIKLRVNSVIGPHNIADIEMIYEMVSHLGASQWALIPLKTKDGTLDDIPRAEFKFRTT